MSASEFVVSSVRDISTIEIIDEDVLQKSLRLHNLSVIFEFYDNFLILSAMNLNNSKNDFIRTTNSKTDNYLNKLRNENKNFMSQLPNQSIDKDNQVEDFKKFYILRRTDIFILVKVKLRGEMEIEVDVRTSPLLVFLNQR